MSSEYSIEKESPEVERMKIKISLIYSVFTYSVVKRAIGDWMERKHTECWKSGKDCKHSKALIKAGLLNG